MISGNISEIISKIIFGYISENISGISSVVF
jgi:hypothetical protein